MEYLTAIKSKNDDKYDMLSHKNSKFLFDNFNNFLNRIGKQAKLVRHTKISDDDSVLQNLQEENEDFSTNSSTEEKEIIYDLIENLDLCKSVYNVIYIGVADSFCEYSQSLPQSEFNDTDQDLRSNGFFF